MVGRRFYALTVAFSLLVIPALALVSCQPGAASALSTDRPSRVDFNTAPAQMYSFTGSPGLPTTLTFQAETPGTPFSAEVRDSKGKVVAFLDSGTLHTAALTVPPGAGLYQVAVVSSNRDQPGKVALSVSASAPGTVENKSSAPAADSLPVAFTNHPLAVGVCRLSTDSASGVNVRSGADMSAPVIDVLPPNAPIAADQRTAAGWYRVHLASGAGWVPGSVVTLTGLCDSLPLQNIPLTPNALPALGGAVIPGVAAPYDQDSYYVGLDLNSGGQFKDAISYPNGDSTDRLMMAVSNFPDSINAARTYLLALHCEGNGAEYLRWGTPENPTFGCGARVALTLSTYYNQQGFVVTLPGGVGQSYVDYALYAEPIAPEDLSAFPLGLDRDGGGQLTELISYPGGDTSDLIQISVSALTDQRADNYREFMLTLVCDGAGTEFVRWGSPENPALTCGGAVILPFAFGANLQTIAVLLPQGSGQSYVSYTLWATVVAPQDSSMFLFGVDRDSGGQFNETISYPHGDQSDMIQVMASNLAQRPPNNYREFTLTLLCSGVGTETVRWGLPEKPVMGCGSSITTPFLYSASTVPLVVTIPEGSGRGYVHYTLLAIPVQD